jgi:hypothetical protein
MFVCFELQKWNRHKHTYCTMLGVPDQFWAPIVQVTPLKTPFGLLTLLFQSQSHVVTITYNYCLHCYTIHCWLATICVDSSALSVLTIDSCLFFRQLPTDLLQLWLSSSVALTYFWLRLIAVFDCWLSYFDFLFCDFWTTLAALALS